PSIHAAQNTHSEECTADKEIPLSSEDQALHDELVSFMHQESIAKIHNDAQRNAFEKEKRRIALAKGKESVNSTLTLSTANTPSQSTGVHTLELEDGTMIHMLAERRYPLSNGNQFTISHRYKN
ncbi:hypothetical protein Tco_1581088, partial [Tanacetum coccineum]